MHCRRFFRCTLAAWIVTSLVARGSDAGLVRDLATPAAANSQCSNLTAASDGTLYLTYTGPGDREDERALRLATLPPGASAWSAPRTIISTPQLAENWADFASLAVGTDGALTAQWFQKAGTGMHAYSGWFSRSDDGGRTWRTPAPLGKEFIALAPLSGGRTLAVWLENVGSHDSHDGHATPAKDGESLPAMRLQSRLLAPDGASLGDWLIDPDVCTCCQNTVAVLPDGRVFAAYRGHTAGEIRDNKYVIFDGRGWSAPRPLKDDHWKIPACPVNGPAADSRGSALAVAWFTAADGVARVQARQSSDAGRTLGVPVQIDLGRPMGRIETVMLADSSALFFWMEAGTDKITAGVYVRRLFPDGRLSAARLVVDSTQARSSGFPRAALRSNGRVVMSWTQPGDISQVRVNELNPASLTPAMTLGQQTIPAGRALAIELCGTDFLPSP